MRTLLIGFGRAGAGLHWSVLRHLRRQPDTAALFAADPPLVCDPGEGGAAAAMEGLIVVGSPAEAAERLPPHRTVVHICAPPVARLDALRAAAAAGFRQLVMEKPLAADADGAYAVVALSRAHGLRIVPVAQWRHSVLTQRLAELIEGGQLGAPRSLSVVQRKPRVMRTLRDRGHPTAFDVELPHSVGVALDLLGDARVVGGTNTDMRIGSTVVPHMGTARLLLEHAGGIRTDIFSDLTAPVRERRIEVEFDRGRAVGHYPVSEDDHFASLLVTNSDGTRSEDKLFDDSLGVFLAHTYRRFAAGDGLGTSLDTAVRVVQLLDDAKRRLGAGEEDRIHAG